jgi:hypothetical protein
MSRDRTAAVAAGHQSLPDLDAGLTVLRTPHPRATVLHRLALATVRDTDGVAYWLDAKNTASTYALHELAEHPRCLRRIRIARAFTAHQQFTLCERLVNCITPRTGCVVVPNAASLYRDDDVPAYEAEPLFEAAITALTEVCTTYGVRLLVTDAGPADDLTEILDAAATATYDAEETKLGTRVVGEDFETTVYWDDTGWQTTIPYWVDLCGTVDETAAVGPASPVTPAMHGRV